MTSPQTPRVSVLLPCKDVEPWLPECIESLGTQTEARYEVLVADDGSSDGTVRLLAAWAERDPRVRPVFPRTAGLVPTLTALAAEARAPLVARMDADDVARPTRLADQIALLDGDPSLAACGTGVAYFPRSAVGSGYARYEEWLNGLAAPDDIERDLFIECPIAHPTLMMRRYILEDVGGYRDFDGPEDYDLILRLAAAGHGLANTRSVLHEWRLGSHRHSERSDRYSADAFRRLKIEHLRPRLASVRAEEGADGRPLVVWGAGRVGKAFVRTWLETGGDPFDALVELDPRKIGQEIHGAPVIGPDELADRFASLAARPYVLIAVGSPGAREDIRGSLGGMGATEIEDFRAVA